MRNSIIGLPCRSGLTNAWRAQDHFGRNLDRVAALNAIMVVPVSPRQLLGSMLVSVEEAQNIILREIVSDEGDEQDLSGWQANHPCNRKRGDDWQCALSG